MKPQLDLGELTADDFLPFIDQIFETRFHGNAVKLRLAKCESVDRPQIEGLRKPFQLTFLSEQQTTLPQGSYELTCPLLGTMHVFLVPGSTGKIQAIFH